MKSIDFEKISETFNDELEIKSFLQENSKGFIFQIKIERARHYSDLAQYYLEAAYIGQNLIKYSKRLDYDLNWDLGYHPVAQLSILPKSLKELSSLIFYYGKVYSGEYEEESEDFMDSYFDYRENLEGIKHAFPELVDDYYANYINGEYYEYSPTDDIDFFNSEFKNFPERKFGFWKCAFSDVIGEDFFVSTDSWIIPKNSNFQKILKEYSGIKKINFLKADFFALGNISYLISNGLITHFPLSSLLMAKHCAHEILDNSWYKEDFFSTGAEWMRRFMTFDRNLAQLTTSKENYRGYPEDKSEELINAEDKNENLLAPPPVMCFYLSEYGDHILVKDSLCSYLFFGTDSLAQAELITLGNRLSELFQTTANLAGIHIEVKCPWELLDDESFEGLCYDIIYYNPKFDNSTIRKMGKSRSRDGGRDIVVFTHSRPGVQSKKYIFQCKYLKPESSLTASKVIDISDTVSQYGATGYGIMSNVVLDATLFDKLDRLNENLKIEIEDYSVYKLERILACYPQLKKRHFNGS